MQRHAVGSSVMSEVRYDPGQMVLEVLFRTGETYRYAGVPENVFSDFLHPPGGSHGRYFNDHIKGAYPFERVEH